ncbi:MAG: hypothetical protein DWQ07_17695 [Chloroflexi bacterium]|nr:MAG: hypothetical protein DWQ07_17695 [Chloroflexota bacterium]
MLNNVFQKAIADVPDEAQDLLNIDPEARAVLHHHFENGYNQIVSLAGKVGASELGLHCKVADLSGLVACTNDKRTYAFVLLEDGTVLGGAFHDLDNGRFSLS